MSDGWEQALRDCEARIDTTAAALNRGARARLDEFTEPVVGESLPAGLVPRARELVERGEQLERRLADEQARIRAELRRLPRMPAAQHTAKFDARG